MSRISGAMAGVIEKKPSIDLSKVSKSLRSAVKNTLKLFFEEHGNYMLLKDSVSITGYCLLYGALLVFVIRDPFHIKASITYSDFSTSAILVTTALIALLIPIGISLMDSTDLKLDFVPSIVFRHVVKFQWLTGATFVICAYCVLPNNGRWKELLTPLVIVGWFIFLMSFLRAYLWLSDATPPSLKMLRAKDGSEPPASGPGGRSYKFSRIAKWLFSTTDERPWQTVWGERWLPVDYEYQLHLMFIAKVELLINKKTKESMSKAGLFLAIYVSGLKNRNLKDWRFYGIYLEKFLRLYVTIRDLSEKRESGGYLWQGLDAMERLFQELFSSGFKLRNDYELFRVVQKYCEDRNLTKKLGDDEQVREDSVTTMFLESYFDAVFSDQLALSDTYFKQYNNWSVTFNNLYTQRMNLSFIVERTYSKWLRDKIKGSPDERFRVDRITSIVFPEADTITVSQLYWFMTKLENTTDVSYALERYVNDLPRFGYASHVSAIWDSSEDGKSHEKAAIKQIQDQEVAAEKLFAYMYPQYFGSFTLRQLQAAKRKLLKFEKIDADHMPRFEGIYQVLENILKIYKQK